MINTPTQTQNASGCTSPFLLILIWIWIVFISIARIVGGAFISALEGMVPESITIWLPVIQLILIVPPLALLAWRWKNQPYQATYRAWLLASLYILFLLPVHLTATTAMLLQAGVQILLSLVYIAIVTTADRRRPTAEEQIPGEKGWQIRNLLGIGEQVKTPIPFPLSPGNQRQLILIALIISGLFAWPWLAWGSLGSPLDALLQLLTGLVFGWATAITVRRIWLAGAYSLSGFLFISLSVGTVLFLMASGFGYPFDVMQALLMVSLFSLGGVVAWIMIRVRGPLIHKLLYPVMILVGLCAAVPLMWIDPDELALVVSFSTGDILAWSSRAAEVSFGIGLLASLFLYLRLRMTERPVSTETVTPTRSRASLLIPVVIITWLIGAGIYFIIGQPGFYGEGLFVILKDQLDVSSLAGQQSDPAAQRSLVYQRLVEHAVQSQAPLLQALDRFHIAYTTYYLENAVEVQGGPLVRLWLEQRSDVSRVQSNPWLRPLPEPPPVNTGSASLPSLPLWNQQLIEANRVWNELHVTGKGIVIGQSDSGVQWDHPELKDGYRGWNAATGQLDNNYNWYDPWYGTSAPVDIGGHGTHTLGTAVGDQVGIAPDATWYACANLVRNLGNPSLYLDCMQFMLAPFPLHGDPFKDGDPKLGANVINDSWGCPDMEGCGPETLKVAVDALHAAGIFVVASAGNSGPACDTVTDPPALYAASYTVGAIDQQSQLVYFSSRGPVTIDGSDRVKPDIVAPGENVLSSMPENTYGILSGTSMAGPHLVGVVALMWSANPNLIGNVDLTQQILDQTTQTYQGTLPNCPGAQAHPSTSVGYGIVDAYAAVKAALSVK